MTKKGFTIVEMLMYIGLFSTVLLVTTQILISITDMYLESSATASLENNATYLSQKLQYDLLRSTRIMEPADPAVTGNRLVLQINGSDYIYEIQNQVLLLTAEDETNQLSTNDVNVSELTVKRVGDGTATDSARLDLTLQSKFVEADGRQRTKSYFIVGTPR